jgi:hypothetical protein
MDDYLVGYLANNFSFGNIIENIIIRGIVILIEGILNLVMKKV